MENTQIVKEAYGHFGSGNIDGLVNLFTEDIKWQIPEINGSPFNAITNGSENVREFFGLLGETEEFTNFEPKEFISEGNKVVVLGHSAGKVIATGQNFESDWVHIFTIEDGKIAGFLEFFDNAAMERAYQRSATA
jgi:ketosteroid isomerase-like protein